METVSVRERFRPARIAMLIAEGDQEQFDAAIRLNTALLGGIYNPIVSYSTNRQEDAIRILRLYDPDIIHPIGDQSLTWLPDDLIRDMPRHYSELYISQPNGRRRFLFKDVLPVIHHLWREVARIDKSTGFVSHDIAPTCMSRLFFRTVCGEYPDNFVIPYGSLFNERLHATTVCLNDDTPVTSTMRTEWMSRLGITSAFLEMYSGPRLVGLTLFVGDPLDLVSLTEFWNLRASGMDIIFVPVHDCAGAESHLSPLFESAARGSSSPTVNIFFPRSASSHKLSKPLEDVVKGLFAKRNQMPSIWPGTILSLERHVVSRFFYSDQFETLARSEE